MIINGITLEDLDIFDIEVAEKCERALDKVKEVSNIKDDLKGSQVIKRQCIAINECFNELFGEGTDKKVFGGKMNIITSLKAFEELILAVKEKSVELEKISSKYSPNRAKRRSSK